VAGNLTSAAHRSPATFLPVALFRAQRPSEEGILKFPRIAMIALSVSRKDQETLRPVIPQLSGAGLAARIAQI
jgi:hypothetical protein